jgi:enamine deaminase RidA (YjgF/YER057c/UK114 family)
MIKLEETLKKYNLVMPNPPERGGVYEPIKEFGENLYYLSGCTPSFNEEDKWFGKLGRDLTVLEGQEAARICALNLLANINHALGGLHRVKRLVKLLVFVASDDTFYDQPKVANGASELFVEIFGEDAGRSARSAIGVNVLPGNAPVEIELLFEAYPQ